MKTTQDQIEKVSHEYANQSCMMQGEMGFVVREWVSRGFKAGCNWMAGQTLIEERNGVKAKETASAGILTCNDAWTLYMADKDYNTHTSDRAHWAFEFAWNMANASKSPTQAIPDGDWVERAVDEIFTRMLGKGIGCFSKSWMVAMIKSHGSSCKETNWVSAGMQRICMERYGEAATQKARADNIQAELEAAQSGEKQWRDRAEKAETKLELLKINVRNRINSLSYEVFLTLDGMDGDDSSHGGTA